MEEQRQRPYTEFAEPVRKVFRSDWMVLAAALFGAGFIILIVSYLGTLIGLPGLVSQIVSYALLLLFGLLIYKKALVRFSYRLTERMFVVTHVVGKKERAEAQTHLTAITKIRPYSALGQDEGGKRMRLYLGKKEDSTAISYRVGGQERTMLVSISAAMKERLLAQWKSARRS